MTPRGKEAAALALHRFGFGPRLRRDSYSLDGIAADPRGAMLADLERPNAGHLAVDLPSSAQAARAVSDFRAEEHAKQKLALRAAKDANASAMASSMSDAAHAPATAMAVGPQPRTQKAPPTPAYLAERSFRAVRRCGGFGHRICRTAHLVLVEPFLHFGG